MNEALLCVLGLSNARSLNAL